MVQLAAQAELGRQDRDGVGGRIGDQREGVVPGAGIGDKAGRGLLRVAVEKVRHAVRQAVDLADLLRGQVEGVQSQRQRLGILAGLDRVGDQKGVLQHGRPGDGHFHLLHAAGQLQRLAVFLDLLRVEPLRVAVHRQQVLALPSPGRYGAFAQVVCHWPS